MKKVLLALAAVVGYSAGAEFCWKDSYGSALGLPLHTCPGGLEKDGLLCYPPCKPGYKGVGPVCWANCEGGMKDLGATCGKESYGRGAGVPLHACPAGTERDGLLCYPPCKPGFHGIGPVCWANCEGGMKDVGITCAKQSYGRGGGRAVHTCPPGHEQNGLLCYPLCRPGHRGNGPVCWQICPDGYHDDGLTCRKDVHIYGKGCCCFFGACCGNCQPGYHDDGCTCRRDAHIFGKGSYGRGAGVPLGCAGDEELNGALCYPRPRAGYTGAGPVAWQNCVGSTKDAGAFCTKDSYTRTAGVPLQCAANEDQNALLCYPKAKAGYTGVGPVAWQNCVGNTKDAGAFCTKDSFGRTAGVPMICGPEEMQVALLCHPKCKPGYFMVNGFCTVGCPKGWVDCGAGCAVTQEECNDKVTSLQGENASNAAYFATQMHTSGPKPHLANIDKLNKLVATTETLKTRLATYAGRVKDTHLSRTGDTLSDEDAKARATWAVGAVMTGLEARGGKGETWEEAMKAIETIDPAGIIASSKSFDQVTCNNNVLSR